VVAAGAAGLVEFLKGGAEPLEGLVGVERARHEPDTFQKLFPDLLPETGAGVLLDRVVDHLREILIGPVAAGETHQAETGGKQATVRQVVDGRHQFLPGKIARDAEDHQDAGTRDPRQSPVPGVAERIAAGHSSDHTGCRHLGGSHETVGA